VPELARRSHEIAAGVEASKKYVHTCELEVMMKLYDKNKHSLEKDTMKLKKGKPILGMTKLQCQSRNSKRKNLKWSLVVMID
jgi:hypothetical protein